MNVTDAQFGFSKEYKKGKRMEDFHAVQFNVDNINIFIALIVFNADKFCAFFIMNVGVL